MDVALFETLNGGDAMLSGNDLRLYFGYENNIYLGLFGGIPGEITDINQDPQAEKLGYCQNNFTLAGSQNLNSETQNLLSNIELTSAGAAAINEAVKNDLNFMLEFPEIDSIEVTTAIISDDVFTIAIKIINKTGAKQTKLIKFRKKSEGDFFLTDFNDDFNV